MSDETKLPPGWLRLTVHDGRILSGPANRCETVMGALDGPGSIVVWNGWHYEIAESPAEVLSRIAEAQRAQRRFDALPGMAATLRVANGAHYESSDWPWSSEHDAVEGAIALLDAIEARERGE